MVHLEAEQLWKHFYRICLFYLKFLSIIPNLRLNFYPIFFFFPSSRKTDTEESALCPYVSTTFTLPALNVECIPVSIGLNLPAYGNVKTLLPLIYEVHNKTSFMQELEAVMEPSDSFMFSGNKQVYCSVIKKSLKSLISINSNCLLENLVLQFNNGSGLIFKIDLGKMNL